jgi:hypothetical protein
VSLSSVVRFLRLKRSTGNIRPAKFGGYKPYSLAAYEKLLRRLVAQPDMKQLNLDLPVQPRPRITTGGQIVQAAAPAL